MRANHENKDVASLVTPWALIVKWQIVRFFQSRVSQSLPERQFNQSDISSLKFLDFHTPSARHVQSNKAHATLCPLY